MNSVCSFEMKSSNINRFLDLMDEIRKKLGEEILDIASLKGGVSNETFLVTAKSGKKLVVRIAAGDYDRFLSRKEEKHNALLAAEYGIAPKIYVCHENGDQIMEYLDRQTLHEEDFQTESDVVKTVMTTLRKFHQSCGKFEGNKDIVAGIREYLDMRDEYGSSEEYEGWDRIMAAVERIEAVYRKNPPESVSCHCDTLAENWMYDGKDVKLIDWEFSAMSDPYFDVGNILAENKLDEKCCDFVIRAYCEGEPTPEQKARIYINRFLSSAYWSSYSMAIVAAGRDRDFYWPYGESRKDFALVCLDDPFFDGYLNLLENI